MNFLTPPSLSSPSTGHTPLTLKRTHSDGSPSERSPLAQLPAATAILKSSPSNSPKTPTTSDVGKRSNPTTSLKTFSLPANTASAAIHTGAVKSLKQHFEALGKGGDSPSSTSPPIRKTEAPRLTAAASSPNKKDEDAKLSASTNAAAISSRSAKPSSARKLFSPSTEARDSAKRSALQTKPSHWTAIRGSELFKTAFDKAPSLRMKNQHPIFGKRSEVQRVLNPTDYHWCWAVPEKRRAGKFSPGEFPKHPHFKEFIEAHPKLWATLPVLTKQIEKSILDHLPAMLREKWKTEFFAEHEERYGIADLYQVVADENDSWSLAAFWKHMADNETDNKQIFELQKRWSDNRINLLSKLAADFPEFNTLIAKNPRQSFLEKHLKSVSDKTASTEHASAAASLPKGLEKEYKAFAETQKAKLAQMESMVREDHLNFFLQAENKPFATITSNYQKKFFEKCAKDIFAEIDGLLKEYQQHSFERFHRLFNIYADFINRILIAGKAAEIIHPDKKCKGLDPRSYVLNRMLSISEANTSQMSSKKYRDTQGTAKPKEKVVCNLEQNRFVEKMSMIFHKAFLENTFTTKWEEAHTVPGPGIFSWTYVSPTNKPLSAEHIKKEDRVNRIDSHILHDPFMYAFTEPQAIDQAFQIHIVDSFNENSDIDKAINNLMFEFSNWALHQASETEHLPSACNEIDRSTEADISGYIEGDSKLKAEGYKDLLQTGLINLLKEAIVNKRDKVEYADVVRSQKAYCEAAKKSIRAKLEELNTKYSTVQSTSNKLYVLMQRQMLASQYASLRFAEFVSGIKSGHDDFQLTIMPAIIPADEPTSSTNPTAAAATASAVVKTAPQPQMVNAAINDKKAPSSNKNPKVEVVLPLKSKSKDSIQDSSATAASATVSRIVDF